MIAVERAVRPVRAFACRKLRMREELLAHLTAVLDEERSRRGDERAALAAALQRFGDPAGLTRELEASVPALERALCGPVRGFSWLAPVGRLVGGPPGLAGRQLVLWQAAAAAAFALVPLLGLLSLRVAWEGTPGARELLAWAGCLAGLAGTAFAFALLCDRLGRALDGGPGAGPVFRAAGWAVPGAGLALAALLLSRRLLLGEVSFDARGLLPAGAVLLGTTVALGLAMRGAAAGRRRLEEWARLELGD
jgi:hypothetical protein